MMKITRTMAAIAAIQIPGEFFVMFPPPALLMPDDADELAEAWPMLFSDGEDCDDREHPHDDDG